MRAVAIGGGHGLSRSLQALRRIANEVTAIVTVADDGGSSGRLRRDLGVAPPGDLRMALAALADNQGLADLLQYRFREGELEGHALGNLMIVAMAEQGDGGLVDALDRLSEHLGICGRVLPCTTTPLVMHAQGPAGTVSGQLAIATSGPPSRVWIEPSHPVATPEAVTAIRDADLIVLGPGSIYTSILPNLLVPGIGEALVAADAPVMLIANMREQVGETEGLTLVDHIDALVDHLHGLRIDVVLGHVGPQPAGEGSALDARSSAQHASVGRVAVADLLGGNDGHDSHDPERLAQLLLTEASRARVPVASETSA
jgi:uncharacterized cofD-like protein